MKVNLAYQIYSAREAAEADLLSVLKELAAMGYDGVEFAGFYGHTADGICAMLAETGLKAVSSHYPFAAIVNDMEGAVAFHNQIGCKYIAIPYLDDDTRPGAPGFAKTLQTIWKFGAMCKEAGIQLLYHNHDFEFIKMSGQYGLDFMYDAIPADYLATELDTCWVNVAGESPVEYIHKYAGRCPIVHLKDFVGSKVEGEVLYELIAADNSDNAQEVKETFAFRPVGYGKQDMPAIVKAGVACGAEWFVVEQDISLERTPLEAAKMSCDFVRGIQ